MSNSINSLSPSFRDYLLLKNLVTDTVVDNGLEALLNGIGLPTQTETPPNAVQPSNSINLTGIFYQESNTILNQYQGNPNDYTQVNIVYNQSNSNITNQGPYNNSNKLLGSSEDYRDNNTIKNAYVDKDKQDTINLNTQPVPVFQNLTSYIDENNNLAIGGPSTQAADVIAGIVGGQGVGFDVTSGSLIANEDIRGTLLGRVLGATGVINDTPLGNIGGQQLLAHVGYNAAFGLQQETLGSLNLNPLSLLQGKSLVTLNYSITVPKNTVGKVVNFAANIFGVQSPLSLLQSSIFSFDDKGGFIGVENIKMGNEMIKNSGKGQVNSLFNNLRANTRIANPNGTNIRQGYAPGYTDDRKVGGQNVGDGLNPKLYARDDGNGAIIDFINGKANSPISSGNYERSKQISDDGFNEDYYDTSIRETFDGRVIKDGFTWYSENINNQNDIDVNGNELGDKFGKTEKSKKSILYKTQQQFKSGNVKTLVSSHGIAEGKSQINSSVSNVGGYTSKGSGVMSRNAIVNGNDNGPENVFCRTWTSNDRYNSVSDLQKNSGLYGTDPNKKVFRQNGELSVLEDNGFVRIAPYKTDKMSSISGGKYSKETDNKRYMFSIENLAWNDNLVNLLPCEIGPGDSLSGRRGRIMWFPPYDITFNETTSASWDKHNFIGRGEPIYTYNNTERTGTLSWKIIIDHPNYLNFMSTSEGITTSNYDDFVASFFAGCIPYENINSFLTIEEKDKTEVKNKKKEDVEVLPDNDIPPDSFDVYFPNDVYDINKYPTYEDGKIKDCNEGGNVVTFIYDNNGKVIEIDYGQLDSDGNPVKEVLNSVGDPNYLNTPGTFIWYLNDYQFHQGTYNSLKSQGYFPNLPFTIGINYFTTLEVSEFNEYSFYDCDLGFAQGETLNRFNEYNNMVNLGYISLLPFNVHIPYSTSGFETLNSGTTAPFISEFTYYANVLNISEQSIVNLYNNLYAPPLLPPNDYPWVEFLIFNGEPGNHFVPHCWKLQTEDNDCNINRNDSPDGNGNGLGTYTEMCYQFESEGKTVWSSEQCTKSKGPKGGDGRLEPDRTNYGLNAKPVKLGDKTYKNWRDPEYHKDLQEWLLTKCKSCKVEVIGYASTVGTFGANRNDTLSELRAINVRDWLLTNVLTTPPFDDKIFTKAEGKGATDSESAKCNAPNAQERKKDYLKSKNDEFGCKANRYVTVKFTVDENLKVEEKPKLENEIDKSNPENIIIPKISPGRFYSECDYFEKLAQTSPTVYDTISEKIKYFQPSFHSTTPEGFNSRLTFLQQCMRQGPTKGAGSDNNPNNLAFGAPPVCILRIGDFYHTKIVIENLSFGFEPLVWDLNPEGVGVQPMICNVDMSFNFIGGSSLQGPINKLQNAVSFNYFANTEIYDLRSDTIVIKDGEGEIVNGESDITGTKANSIVGSNKQTVKDQVKQNEVVNSGDNVQPLTPAETPVEKVKKYPGFDEKTGTYTVQNAQILTNFIPDNIKSDKIIIPRGTKVYLSDRTENTVIKTITGELVPSMIVNQGKNPTKYKLESTNKKISLADKIYYNQIHLDCNSTKSNKFLVDSTLAEKEGEPKFEYFAHYTNDTLGKILTDIFCKGARTKTLKEIKQFDNTK